MFRFNISFKDLKTPESSRVSVNANVVVSVRVEARVMVMVKAIKQGYLWLLLVY